MPSQTGIVTASALNLRADPSTAHPPTGSFARGDALEILGRSGSWYRVRRGDAEGFVHGDFVRLRESEPASGFLHERPALREAPLAAPDGERIDTGGLGGAGLQGGRTWNRYGGLLRPLCDTTVVEPASAVAVLCVESSGSGFRNGRLIIRFENHVFRRQWPDAVAGGFDQHFRFDPSRAWQGHQFRPDDGPWLKCHTGQDREWEAFTFARGLNEAAALRSISMGSPQIMGFNSSRIGYDSAAEMFARFSEDERYHLLGMFDFIVGSGTTSPMLEALQQGRYEQFASHYNGPGQAAIYGGRLRTFHDAFPTA